MIETVHEAPDFPKHWPMESCCFCNTPTPMWCEKDVPVCNACAKVRTLEEVPTKEDWCAGAVVVGPAIDIFHTSKGTLVIIAAPYEMSRDHPEITGKIVHGVDKGMAFRGRVKAVDRFMPTYPIRKGEHIGLLLLD